MALNGDTLGIAIVDAVSAYVVALSDPAISFVREDFWKIVGKEIVSHIKVYGSISIATTGTASIVGAVSGPDIVYGTTAATGWGVIE